MKARICVWVFAATMALAFAACGCGDDDDSPSSDSGATGDDGGDDDSSDDDSTGDDGWDDDEQFWCGDGDCQGEDCLGCAVDCDCSCGDGACTFGESCANCPDDCDCETLAATPPMGWNSWNRFGCEIDEALIRDTADALVESGMRDAGYVYLNLDDCWQSDRDVDGTIIADPVRFPSGIPALAQYVHERGLRFGLYTCAGEFTCQGKPGSFDHEYQDAQTYAEWGVDYVKVDWCNTDGLDPKERYGIFHDAIYAAGGEIVLSICDWGVESPWVWGPGTGQLWRTTGDISDDPVSLWWNMIRNEPLDAFAGPGAWNDPDMLEVGNGGMNDKLYRTHFNLWAMMAAPLIAGNDLRDMSPETLEILTNAEVIAVDQDPSGIPGRRMTWVDGKEMWMRPLAQNGARAVMLFNGSFLTGTASVAWEEIGLADAPARVRDLWAHEDLGDFETGFEAVLEPFESRMLLVTGEEYKTPTTGATHLSEWPWIFTSSYTGKVKKNVSANGGPISIGGEVFDNGLSATAASRIVYHLGGRCSSFSAMVGVDDETDGAGSVVFQAWVDGEKMPLSSRTMKGGDPAERIELNLGGRSKLQLVVTPGDDSIIGDHADWADIWITCY